MARKKLVLGLANVARVFRQLPKENLKRITNSLNLGASEMVVRAKSIAPVSSPIAGQKNFKDTIRKTRIRIRSDGKSAQIFVLAGNGTGDETDQAAFRSEFGRAPDDQGHPGHRPQPSFFPAYHSLRKRIRGRVAREVNRAGKAVALRSRIPR